MGRSTTAKQPTEVHAKRKAARATLGPVWGRVGRFWGLGTGRMADWLVRAIEQAVGRPQRVVVHGGHGDRLARALSQAGLPVIAVSERPRRRKKGPLQVAARLDALPFPDGCADAVVVVGLPDDALGALVAFSGLLREGGVVAVVSGGRALGRRPPPAEHLAGLFVHAGLCDIEQHQAGASVVSLGHMRDWDGRLPPEPLGLGDEPGAQGLGD